MIQMVKLCGIRTKDDLAAAVSAGADAIGVVLTPSVRQVDIPIARKLVEAAPDGLTTVGVFYLPDADLVREARDEVGFDLIQAEPESLRGIDAIVTLPVVHEGPDLGEAVARAHAESGSGMVLVEGVGRGGQGRSPDWTRVRDLAEVGDVVLAGGLTPENVNNAIEIVRPRGVDVSSGVESSPGVKDPGLMMRFVVAARSTDRKGAGI